MKHNFVAKHDFNRASVHRDKSKYCRKGNFNWLDEIEPPKYL